MHQAQCVCLSDVDFPCGVEFPRDAVDIQTVVYNLGLLHFYNTEYAPLCLPPCKNIIPAPNYEWNKIKMGVDLSTHQDERMKAVIPHAGIYGHTVGWKIPVQIVNAIHSALILIENETQIRQATDKRRLDKALCRRPQSPGGETQQHAHVSARHGTLDEIILFLQEEAGNLQAAARAAEEEEESSRPPTKTRKRGQQYDHEVSDGRLVGGEKDHPPVEAYLVCHSWKGDKAKKIACAWCSKETRYYCVACNEFICHPISAFVPDKWPCWYLQHSCEYIDKTAEDGSVTPGTIGEVKRHEKLKYAEEMSRVGSGFKPKWMFYGQRHLNDGVNGLAEAYKPENYRCPACVGFALANQ
jgi:hypothetical protein